MYDDDYFDIPAGFRDADIEQADLEAQANRSAALRRKGICDHGWLMGIAASGEWFGEGPRPADGMALCLHCGQHVKDWSA